MIPKSKASAMTSLFFGGLLPVIAFTIIEEKYGPLWGTVAGMTFGMGEIIFEKVRYQKVSTVTWIANALILALGGISILSQDGIWFKLQPALFEGFFAVLLWGSLIAKKPFLLMMAEKQGTVVPDFAKPILTGLTFRLGFFFFIHAIVATWAAISWTTAQWAWLKGAGVMITFAIYLGLEVWWMRKTIRRKKQEPPVGGS